MCRSLLVTLLPVNMAVNGLWGTFFCYPTNMPFWLFWALFGSLEPLRAPESSQELSGASGSFRLLRASYSPLEPLRAPERADTQFVPDQFVYTPYVPTHNWSTPFLSQHPIGQHPFCPSTQFVDTLFVPAPEIMERRSCYRSQVVNVIQNAA